MNSPGPTKFSADEGSALRVSVRDRVWWSDVDQMGIMYFGRYVRFAEMAETEYFRAIGYSYDELHATFGIWLARVHLEVDFRAPARLDEELSCSARVVKLGSASIHFRFAVDRIADERRLADIGLVVACLDATTLRSTRMPPALRERLAAVEEPDA
jgi:YbgC/YbaW family acyl-CoA thioester hydrolase